MKKIALITGSETFGKYIFNPTKWLALKADGKVIGNHLIHSLVFPSVIRFPEEVEDPGTTIVRTAMELKASVILSFGMASEVKGFRIERSATNWVFNEKYCTPSENNRPILKTRPPKEQIKNNLSPWNLETIIQAFVEKNIPFDSQISDNPGQYSCNSWIYQTLLALKKYDQKIPYIFIHVSCTEEAIEFIPDFPRDKKIIIRKEDLLSALEIFLQAYKS